MKQVAKFFDNLMKLLETKVEWRHQNCDGFDWRMWEKSSKYCLPDDIEPKR